MRPHSDYSVTIDGTYQRAAGASAPKWRDMTIARLPKETEESSVSLRRILGGLEEVPNKEQRRILCSFSRFLYTH